MINAAHSDLVVPISTPISTAISAQEKRMIAKHLLVPTDCSDYANYAAEGPYVMVKGERRMAREAGEGETKRTERAFYRKVALPETAKFEEAEAASLFYKL